MTYMVQACFDPRLLYEWARMKGISDDEDYTVHGALRAAFGSLGPQPWVTQSGPSLTILGYGDADAGALRQAAGLYAEPSLSVAILDVQTKQMPIVSAGMVVGFRI